MKLNMKTHFTNSNNYIYYQHMDQTQNIPHLNQQYQKIYSIARPNWISKYPKSKKPLNYPTKRYCHTTVLYNQSLYIFGGIQKKQIYQPVEDFVYRLNLINWSWQKIWTQRHPKSRDSHGCCLINHKMIIFGGTNNEILFNDLWAFDFKINNWNEIEQIGRRPEQRELCTLINYNDNHIILFGGMNHNIQFFYADIQLFSLQKSTWQFFNLTNKPDYRMGASFVKCYNSIYMFGGYEQSIPQKYFDDLYQITIKLNEMIANFNLIKVNYKPPGRFGHSMIDFLEKYLVLIGGQGEQIDKNDQTIVIQKDQLKINKLNLHKNIKSNNLNKQAKKKLHTKNDAWIFSIKDNKWIQLQIQNSGFRSRIFASISKYENNIYIFGGMKKNTNLLNDLMILNFQQEKYAVQQNICSNCFKAENQQKQDQYIKELYEEFFPAMSNNYLYNVASIQSFPFNGIGLIADAALILRSEIIRISIRRRLSELSYMAIQYEGENINNKQFIQFINNKQNDRGWVNEYANNIKFGSLRLGKTFIYINKQQNLVRVFLFSVNSSIVPNSENSYRYFAYIQNTNTKLFYTQNGHQNKAHIINFLSSQVQNPEKLINQAFKHSLYIFQMNLITTSKSVFYYELVTISPYDIGTLINHNKIQFLDQIGYNISRQPDVSLKSYLQILYLNEKIEIFINQCNVAIQSYNYRQILQDYEYNNQIQKIKIDCFIPQVKQICLYQKNQNEELKQFLNLGILIYQNGRLITRYGSELGKLFCDKFYKKKYKQKKKELFKYFGIIQVNNEFLKANIVKTDFQNNQFSIPFWGKIKNLLKERHNIDKQSLIQQSQIMSNKDKNIEG